MAEPAVLQRLAKVVLEARGDRSQRDFARLLGVAQSTIQSWENGRNTPSLDNLEKLAKMRGQLPEEFVAYLYGRLLGASALPVEQQVSVMSCRDISKLMAVIARRLEQE